MRSMMVSQDTPNASEAPAIQAAIRSSVAPRKLSPEASPVPTSFPTTPPALCRSGQPCQCNVTSPQLASSTRTKPPTRTAVLARDARSVFLRLRKTFQEAMPIITGKRNAGRPNRKNRTSAAHAPIGPMRLRMNPLPPVKENPGSSAL